MRLARFRTAAGRWTVVAVSVLAALHFGVSFYLWLMALWALRQPAVPWARALPDVGFAGLFVLWFVAAAIIALRGVRVSVLLLLVALVLMGVWFARDALRHNWQMHVESYRGGDEKTLFYFTWWWYDQRWLPL